MTQREKLIELLNQYRECLHDREIDCNDCDYKDVGECFNAQLADYLLANGVVLPCRCGECEHNKENENYRFCEVNQRMIDRYGYCQHAKRKGGDE